MSRSGLLGSLNLATFVREEATGPPPPRGGRGGEEDAMVREGGRQLCPRPAVPSSVIAAGRWPGAGVWKRWGDRDWEGGKGTATGD